MTRTSRHAAAMRDINHVLKVLDSPAAPITEAAHIRAMGDQMHALKVSLSDGLDQPLERFRLARIAAHAIALMTEENL